MSEQESLIVMLKQLREDMLAIQQLGAGYYSCHPIIQRYNKLLQHGKRLYPGEDALINSFDAISDSDPSDPGEKIKIVQAIRIEIGQLLALLESVNTKPGAEIASE